MRHPPLTEEQRALVAENLGIARAVANQWRKYAYPWTDPDDLDSEAYAGLCRAAQTWTPTKSKFSTYGWLWAEQCVRRFLKKDRGNVIHLPEHRSDLAVSVVAFGAAGGEDSDFASTIPAREPSRLEQLPDEAELWAQIDWLLDDPRQAAVLRGRFKDGRRLDDIGRELGVTKERVRQIEAAAIASLADEKELLAEVLAV